MALTAVMKNPTISNSSAVFSSFSKMAPNNGTALCFTIQGIEFGRHINETSPSTKLTFPSNSSQCLGRRSGTCSISWESSVLCQSARTQNTETNRHVKNYGDCSDTPSAQIENEEHKRSVTPERFIHLNHSNKGFAEACKFACNDAKFVSARARNDIFLLSRGISSLDARAREDFAILGFEFLKLDARAREDTGKIDHKVKRKAKHVKQIAYVLKNKAGSRLKRAADKHWSDGALEADLRRADFCAKQRAIEDAFMALKFMKDVQNMMVGKLYNFPLHRTRGFLPASDDVMCMMHEKNGRIISFFDGVSSDRITAIQEAYLSMASALSEADGIDYTNPEELELLVGALIDLDAMDGKSSVALLAECSRSPDVNTRQALANALAAAPSMWTLGNAGMGALRRLAEDSNPAVSGAASRGIRELEKQWEIENGDGWRLMVDQKQREDEGSDQ